MIDTNKKFTEKMLLLLIRSGRFSQNSEVSLRSVLFPEFGEFPKVSNFPELRDFPKVSTFPRIAGISLRSVLSRNSGISPSYAFVIGQTYIRIETCCAVIGGI